MISLGGTGFVGVLRCAQDDSKNSEATATATATAKGNGKCEMRGSLHYGTQSAPSSVEMTVFG
jgi:hypothetical protein